MSLYLHPSNGPPGTCDRCGRRVVHDTLDSETVRGLSLNNMVCTECWDEDHPQNWVGSRPVTDKETVLNAQPEIDIVANRSLAGFDPVCGQDYYFRTGIVQVVT